MVMDGLKSGVILAVTCTSLLSVALDLGNIVCGIHFGYPRNMVNYMQEIGRLGRAQAVWQIHGWLLGGDFRKNNLMMIFLVLSR